MQFLKNQHHVYHIKENFYTIILGKPSHAGHRAFAIRYTGDGSIAMDCSREITSLKAVKYTDLILVGA